MGIYINPDNNGFKEIVNSRYVDKTGLISLTNRSINTTEKLTCASRPRRFGKSFAAQMLAAYYSRGCDSRHLFENLEITRDTTFVQHLNQYHVILLDVSGFIADAKKKREPLSDVPSAIERAILSEAQTLYPETRGTAQLTDCLIQLVRTTHTQIVFIIDEWDSPIREAAGDVTVQESYLSLLRSWFKNVNFTPIVVAAAFMTGILPIKKDGSQSAISDFSEYTMLDPLDFARYTGLTEDEVRHLCRTSGRSFEKMSQWYDGYVVGDIHHVYNPYSVIKALRSGKYKSYWKKTSAAETLMTYIDLDLEGLQDDIVRLIAGESMEVATDSFQNDFSTFTCKDDVLTLLIHLGYLTYEEVTDDYDDISWNVVRIPNDEIRSEFNAILRKAKHAEVVGLIQRSDQLLVDTLAGNCAAVACAVQKVHESAFAPTFYSNEQSLRSVIRMAYLTCVDQYTKIEELPSGHGIADVVFIPNRFSSLPAMLIELKWNKTAGGAIEQIKDRNYQNVPKSLGHEFMLVGINYDEVTKEHTCLIEKWEREVRHGFQV